MVDRSSRLEKRPRFPANAKGYLCPPVVWFVWFVLLYSVQGAGCELGLDRAAWLGTSVLRIVLGAMTVAAAGGIAVVGGWAFIEWRELRVVGDDAGSRPVDLSRFLSYGAVLHAGLFFVAVVWTGLPILMTDLCNE